MRLGYWGESLKELKGLECELGRYTPKLTEREYWWFVEGYLRFLWRQ